MMLGGGAGEGPAKGDFFAKVFGARNGSKGDEEEKGCGSGNNGTGKWHGWRRGFGVGGKRGKGIKKRCGLLCETAALVTRFACDAFRL